MSKLVEEWFGSPLWQNTHPTPDLDIQKRDIPSLSILITWYRPLQLFSRFPEIKFQFKKCRYDTIDVSGKNHRRCLTELQRCIESWENAAIIIYMKRSNDFESDCRKCYSFARLNSSYHLNNNNFTSIQIHLYERIDYMWPLIFNIPSCLQILKVRFEMAAKIV